MLKLSPLATTFTCGLFAVGLLTGCATTAPSEQAPSPSVSVDRQAALGTCADGGACAIGDIGPGGGMVFYDAGSEQAWGRYMEAAPAGWNGGSTNQKEVWCDKIGPTVALSESISSGFDNTKTMVAACSLGAANTAATYTGGGKNDWFLPSLAELTELWKQRDKLGISGSDYYWSSSTSTSSDRYPISLSFQDGRKNTSFQYEEEHVRPVRTI